MSYPVSHLVVHFHYFYCFLQLYFDKVAELTLSESDSALFKEALVSLSTDSGLHPLVPYFTCFIADEVIILSFYDVSG